MKNRNELLSYCQENKLKIAEKMLACPKGKYVAVCVAKSGNVVTTYLDSDWGAKHMLAFKPMNDKTNAIVEVEHSINVYQSIFSLVNS